MSVGLWTDLMVQELSIIDSFERFRSYAKKGSSTTSDDLLRDNPLRQTTAAAAAVVAAASTASTNVRTSAEDIERKGMFVKYLSAMTSCRSVLWQLIPGMTAFAILSVDLSSCPVFILSPSIEESHLLPPLLVLNSWSIAEQQIKDGLGGKPNKKPYVWQLALLAFYNFVQESRLIQFAIVIVNNATAFEIVFGNSDLIAVVVIFLVINTLAGVAQFGYTFLLLHQFFFSTHGDDDDDE